MLRATFLSVTLAVLVFPIPGSAASLKGKLKLQDKKASPAQYKVLAISVKGVGKVVSVSSKGAFSAPVSKGTTLHLVGADNRYFGPIVSANGSKAYAVASGKSGSLATISVKNGFAVAPLGKSSNLYTKKAISFSKSKGPKGAGKLGLVRTSAKSSVRAAADKEPTEDIGEDSDDDGIPSTVDVDDDGDMILDASDPDAAAKSPYQAGITSTLRVAFSNSLNASAAGVTAERMEAVLKEGLIFGLRFSAETAQVSAVNVDCGALPYCVAGAGTATLRSDNLNSLEGTPWTSYDPDGNGFPNLAPNGLQYYTGVKPRSSLAQLRPGDTLYFNASTDKGSVTIPAVLPFYFVTGPALKEYTSGGVTTTISYPIAEDAEGTRRLRPLALSANTVTFTMWKPQRPAISGAETGELIDMGHLRYGAHVAIAGEGKVISCQAEDYSVPDGSTLTKLTDPSAGIGKLLDSSADAATSPQNTITYSLDLGSCLTRNGYTTAGRVVMLNILAETDKHDQTSQDVYFKLPE